MIFVSLGTQDKPFKRLCDYLEHSDIDDEIIVQSGFTDYQSDKLKVFKYIEKADFERYLNEADYVICHAGVGTIVNCLKLNKKILTVPRLSKYGEHQNDHQLQIAEAYRQKGYILVMQDGEDFKEKFEELKKFQPKQFISNNEVFVNKLKNYIM
ncbi:MAG: PssE/Cps14G family polysaccharide biosynthesis glycosyltransferase [Erysipelotrichaceae bacterium]|nr:PssE/Cps14G family polysaccharide biosynthesis glycosyltransferase [Erysipelotrichaceae bacterium]